MRVPLSWLRDYVEFDFLPEALADRLTLLGMEVQGIERIGGDWRSIVVGELVQVTPVPATDRLSLTRVQLGDGHGELSIVTGATNVAAGQRVPVALPGAVLPDGREIRVARFADVESHGMLCSGAELRLTHDADGILILPPDAPVGRPLAELYSDVVLDVDVKPNRGDALSMVGLAREVAAVTGSPLRWPDTRPTETGDATAEHVQVEVLDPALCPRFVARFVDAVALGPSPLEVQFRLTAAGQRSVSNVVDASNYVMLELGKPTHTFDAAAVTEGRIVVRRAAADERLETLDHVVRELDPETLVIADPRGPLGIAGVIGGAASEVSETTTSVIIESAIFDPVAIRRTAQRYALRSEASARFEKGQEWRLATIGVDRVAQLAAAWAGGRVATGMVDTNPVTPPLTRVPFRPRRVARLLGAPIDAAEMRELLGRVEIVTEPASRSDAVPAVPGEPPRPLDPEDAASALVAVVPGHRRDLAIEADIAEEVARVRGYETLPAALPSTEMPGYRQDPRRTVDVVRELLSARGLNEAVTHALVGPRDHELLAIASDDPATIRVTNPLSADHSQLRRSLLPGLARVLVHNERQRRGDAALFEIGAVHELRASDAWESRQLGILLAGEWRPGHWDEPGRSADIGDAKGLVEWLVARLATGNLRYRDEVGTHGAVAHPGRRASVAFELPLVGLVELGEVGELHPAYLRSLDVRAERVAFAVVSVDALETLADTQRRFVPVPRVPAVERDLAVVTPETLPAGEVERVIRETAGPLLRGLRLFDRYQGPPLGRDEVSLAYRLQLQAADRTLAEAEIDDLVSTVVSELGARLGAHIRG